jgi:hypothetical protein
VTTKRGVSRVLFPLEAFKSFTKELFVVEAAEAFRDVKNEEET